MVTTLARDRLESSHKVVMSVSNAVVGDVLTFENYEDWKVWMQNYLVGQNLWDIVEGSVKQLPKDDDPDYAAWRDKNGRALHAIQISCGSHMFSLIKQLTSAQEAWKCLDVEYQKKWGRRRMNINRSSSCWQEMKQGKSFFATWNIDNPIQRLVWFRYKKLICKNI